MRSFFKYKALVIFYTFIIFLVLVINSCTNKPDGVDDLLGLTPFTVTVTERNATRAIIQWTESTNLNISNSDTVKYKVYLNNIIIATNLIVRIDTINNISPDTTYNGRVMAYTSADTISAPFTLPKIQEYIAFYTDNNKFEMYNLYSGIRMWNKAIDYNTYNNSKIGPPTISNDTVFFADTWSHVPNPLLYACNVKTGQVCWTALTGIPLIVAGGTNPVYYNGKIILMMDNGVVAVNSATGQVLWTRPITDGNYGMTPVCNNNIVFVVSPQHDLVAINTTNGNVLWTKPVGYVTKAPVLVNGLVVVNTENKIIAYQQTTGALAWEKTFPGFGTTTYWSRPVVSGNIIVAFVENYGFYGINALTGATTWFNVYDWISSQDISYTAGDGKFYCFDSYSTPNKLFALNTSNGSLAWQNINVPQFAWDLVYANKKLYGTRGTTLTGIHGLVNTFNAQTGLWVDTRTLFFSDAISAFTLKLNDTVYYNSSHGNFK